MRLPPPDPLTTACVYIAALFMAVQQGLKGAPDFVARTGAPDLNAGAWNYLPLLLLSAGLLVWLLERIFKLGYHSVSPVPVVRRVEPERAEPAAPAGEREYVPDTLGKHLLGIYRRRHMEAEVSALLRPHVGKWMRLTGYIANLTGSNSRLRAAFRPSPKDAGSLYSVYFDPSAEPLLIALKHGAKVSFVAQIVDEHGYINLKHGEID